MPHVPIRSVVAASFVALLASACTSVTTTSSPHPSATATGSGGTETGLMALDPSFGSGGEVTTSLSSGSDGINAIAIQPDGKIVVAGSDDGSAEFALARYNPDGTLDTTFGDAGTVTTDFTEDNDLATAVAIQPDGKIVAAGYAGQSGSAFKGAAAPNFALARYNTDGTLDSSFGDRGKVITSFTPEGDFAKGIVIQADGKLVVSGGAGDGSNDSNFAVARYDTDGSLDTTFGKGGLVTTDFAGRDLGNAPAIQPDGKIVVSGISFLTRSAGETVGLALARYDPDGSLDPTFGDGGEVVTGSACCGFRVAVQPDGKILATGGDFSAKPPQFTLTRFNADGSVDEGFGKKGTLTSDLLDPFGPIAIQEDGNILAAGGAFTLVRFDPDGTLDTTFGTGGKFTTDFGSGFTSTGVGAMSIQADGSILVAGSASLSKTDSDFALARYLAG